VYSKFRHHPHPLGELVPNFVSCTACIVELAHGEKLHTQSLNDPAYLKPGEQKCSHFGISSLLSRIYPAMYAQDINE